MMKNSMWFQSNQWVTISQIVFQCDQQSRLTLGSQVPKKSRINMRIQKMLQLLWVLYIYVWNVDFLFLYVCFMFCVSLMYTPVCLSGASRLPRWCKACGNMWWQLINKDKCYLRATATRYVRLHQYMWPALPKPATYAHHVKEHFSPSMDSYINKLTIMASTPLPNVDRSAFAEACIWGLSDVHKCSGVHWMPLVGLYRQPPCWKSPYDWLMI